MKDKFESIYEVTGSTGFHKYIENGLFPVLLAFYPLIHINQGLDVVDTAYSLGNFQYFDSSDGIWMVATYLANVLGHTLMSLPYGNTILGMQFYTGLIVSFLAVFFYLVLRKKMPTILVLTGEMIAIGLCWCPTVILYNYLTYLFMGIGVWLLYLGCCEPEESRWRKWYLIAAGICLGANVAVRMPNVVQAAFVLALWYSEWLQRKPWRAVVRDTAYCLGGYLVGFGIPFIMICMRYGTKAYPAMVQNMFAMTDKAADYKPAAMLTGMLDDYGQGLYWFVFAAVCMVALYAAYGFYLVIYRIIRKKNMLKNAEGIKGSELTQMSGNMVRACIWLFRLLCIGVWCVLIRFYWGRGMFHFRYYSYDCVSMYWWAVLLLLTGIADALWMLISRRMPVEEKVLALLVLLQILLTPLGSNNDLYPIINNLFLTAPFTLWCGYLWFRKAGRKPYVESAEKLYVKGERSIRHFPWQSMLLIFEIVLCIQSVGFHLVYVFGDGIWGEKRDTLVMELPKAKGIYTNRENAEYLLELSAYIKENGLTDKSIILYGEIPGLSYLLDMPSAISTTWPDLDSNRLSRFEQDMEALERHMGEEGPVVIVASGIAAYHSEDAEACEWFGVDAKKYDADEKLAILRQFLIDYEYEETFANMRYVVYE